MMTTELLDKLDFKKGNGLIPVVVQDAKTKEVLMLAYANRQAVEHALKTGKGTYWSRSRNELWVKGETSGHTQKIVSVSTDCDYDALIYVVEQTGPACHTGEYTCFHNKMR
jgi:phosphoribosyl-AMP cyclohydrolase